MGTLQALSLKGLGCRSTSPQTPRFWSWAAIPNQSQFPSIFYILFYCSFWEQTKASFFFSEKEREVRTWLVLPEFSASAKIYKKCLTETCFPKTGSIFSAMLNLPFTPSSQTLAQATGSTMARWETVHNQWWRRECSSAYFSLLSFPWAEAMWCMQSIKHLLLREQVSLLSWEALWQPDRFSGKSAA